MIADAKSPISYHRYMTQANTAMKFTSEGAGQRGGRIEDSDSVIKHRSLSSNFIHILTFAEVHGACTKC